MLSTAQIGNAATVDFAAFLPFRFVDVVGLPLGLTVALGIGMNVRTMWKTIGHGTLHKIRTRYLPTARRVHRQTQRMARLNLK